MDHSVGHVGEIREGEMKEVSVNETPVLLVRIDGTYRAFSARCPHYGAPLAEGLLSDGRITCPWHHACFDARTGGLIDPPALDALETYPVRIDGDAIIVDLPEQPAGRRTLPERAVERGAADGIVAIIGAGAAGFTAAQTLRECGDPRRILLITHEARLPYDRPNLSKDYLNGHADPEWMPLRPDEFYAQNDIEVMREARVRKLSAEARTIELEDGTTVEFEAALIATGCAPRTLDVPGAGLANVLALRSFDDADAIVRSSGEGRRAVVVGASFIAMEAAYSLATRGMMVTVVAPDQVPFERTLGPAIGKRLQRIHEANGIQFRLGSGVARFEGDAAVEAVVLADGERLDADVVVVGVGVRPVSHVVEGVELERDGGIAVDSHLCAAAGVYAAGDVASYPDPRSGAPIRIEHWRTAMQMGRVAGYNLAGIATPFEAVPFFWTQQFDTALRYVGHIREWEEIVYRGNVDEGAFLAYYLREGRVHAAAGIGRDRDLLAVAEAIRQKRFPTVDELPG